ncbi:MAG: sensor histidine kinase [Dehalococcoidia bacterium]
MHSGRPSRFLYASAVVITASVLAVVVALPILGLGPVRSSHDEAQTLGAGLSVADGVAREITTLAVLARQIDGSSTAGDLSAFAQEREHVFAQIIVLERFVAAELPALADETGSYAAAARAFMREADAWASHIAATGDETTVPNRAAYFDARQVNLEEQAALFGAAAELLRANDERGTAALTRARWMSVAAAGVAVLLFVAYAGIAGFTRRARLAAALIRLVRAEKAVQENASLVSMASHELRNPLSVLTLSAQLMHMTALERDDDELAGVAEGALSAAHRAEELVAELLDLARVDADAVTLAVQPVLVQEVVDRALTSVANCRPAHRIRREGDSGAVAHADAGRFEVVVRNLIDNAYKYSPAESEVSIHVSGVGASVVLEVQDAGPGIAEADREQVFAHFHRLDQTAHVGGLGIGLYLSRELARRMGGDIVVSDSARGARLKLTLPRAAA